MDLALKLADHGLRDPQLADALTDLAARNRAHPGAGRPAVPRRHRSRRDRAQRAARRCARADRRLRHRGPTRRRTPRRPTTPSERAAAVRIAASVAAHDGGAAQAAELFRWLGPYSDAVVSAAGAVVTIGVGDAAAARAAIAAESAGPPDLDRAGSPQSGRGAVLDAGLAVSRRDRPPGPVDHVRRNRPRASPPTRLRRWSRSRPCTAATRSAPAASSAAPSAPHGDDEGLRRAPAPAAARLGPDAGRPAGGGGGRRRRGDRRYATCTAGMPCGSPRCRPAIARRGGDSGAVQKHWYAAMEVLTEYSLDLYSLLPLGELWVAAGRLRQIDQLQHTLDEAFDLLEPSAIRCCGRCRCTGRACTRASWRTHPRPWRRTARR